MGPEVPQYFYISVLVFTAVTAVAFAIQACVFLCLFVAVMKLRGKVETILDHVTEHALPLIASSRQTLEELSPKLKVISSNLVDISDTLKTESRTIKTSVDDVLEKTRAQTARVDEMVSGTLDGLSQASSAIQHGISVPLRQLNGLLSGFKAGLEVLRGKPSSSHAGETAVPSVAEVEEPVVVVVTEDIIPRPVVETARP